VASVDALGFVKISDRTKDLIKSGGEWISSVDLENALMAHPAVAEAAVIAIPDEKWSERPLACVVLKPGQTVQPAELNALLLQRSFAKWQLPERYEFIDAVPRTSTGKFWKLKLRERFRPRSRAPFCYCFCSGSGPSHAGWRHETPVKLESAACTSTFLASAAPSWAGWPPWPARPATRVTGCDAGVYPPMSDQLRALGIELIEGFDADQMALKPDMWVVGNVVSRARWPDGSPKYPLMEAILDAGAPYTSGPQWLAEHVLQGRHVLAVAGTHGKTTTTSMLAWIWNRPGCSRAFLVGGVPMNFGVSASLGNCTSNDVLRGRAARKRGRGARSTRSASVGARCLRDRSRRVRHGVLRQAQQVRALPPAHGRAEQPGVRPRRHL
jgi:hypothetical protein